MGSQNMLLARKATSVAGLLHFQLAVFVAELLRHFLVADYPGDLRDLAAGVRRSAIGAAMGRFPGPKLRQAAQRRAIPPISGQSACGLERIARFEGNGPGGRRCLIWLETYKHGKLVPKLSWG